jgi:hypothetical protein
LSHGRPGSNRSLSGQEATFATLRRTAGHWATGVIQLWTCQRMKSYRTCAADPALRGVRRNC